MSDPRLQLQNPTQLSDTHLHKLAGRIIVQFFNEVSVLPPPSPRTIFLPVARGRKKLKYLFAEKTYDFQKIFIQDAEHPITINESYWSADGAEPINGLTDGVPHSFRKERRGQLSSGQLALPAELPNGQAY